MFIRKLLGLSANSSSDQNQLSFDQLPPDFIKLMLQMLLLHTSYANAKSFYSVSLTCKMCRMLAHDIFSIEINHGLNVYYALTNKEEEYVPEVIEKTTYPLDRVYVYKQVRTDTVAMKDCQQQVNNQINNNSSATYTLYTGRKKAIAAQAYLLRTKKQTHFTTKDNEKIHHRPIVWEVYCNNEVVYQDHSSVPHNAIFCMRAIYKRDDKKSDYNIFSPTHSFFRIHQTKQAEKARTQLEQNPHDSPEDQHNDDKQFGLTLTNYNNYNNSN